MKKIYRPLLKGTNWALVGLLGILGCSACDEPVDEYGTPYAQYAIKGKVTDTKGTPIPGIQVKAGTKNDRQWMQENPADYPYRTVSNAKGEYAINLATFGKEDFTVYAEDIDGEANGQFKTDSTLVEGNKMQMTGGGHWDEGRGQVTVDFSLTESNEETLDK